MTTNTNTINTDRIAWSDGKLSYDYNTMQFTLDKAGMFYFSAKKGISSTRAFLTAKGKTSPLGEPGSLCTSDSWEAVDGMRWLTMKGDVPRKILVGFQAYKNKIYALVHNWPLKDKGAKKWYTDDDMWHEPLDSTCVIASFDEPISNTAGLMAKANMNEVLKASYYFFSKHFKTVDAYGRYAGGEDDQADRGTGPKMHVKIAMAFDSYVNRQRKAIAKEFKGDHDGELIAVEQLMSTVEPSRMALEDYAMCYDFCRWRSESTT